MKVRLQVLILSIVTLFVVALTFLMYNLAYPLKYQDMIISASLRFEVEAPLIAAVINSESSFDKTAISNKGAVGLMQLMPSTAQAIAGQLEKSEYDLFDPETNIEFGSFYLSKLLKSFSNFEAAICAYNAGPSRVREWLSDENYSSDGETLFHIPYPETQKYLENVLKNLKFYQNRFN